MWIPGITWFSDRRIIWLTRVSLCSGACCKCSYLERNVKWRAEMQGHCTRTQGSLALCFQRLLIIIKRHSQMDWERLLKAIERRWAFKRMYDSWCPSVLMIKVGSLWGPVMWTIYIFISLLSGATGEQIHGDRTRYNQLQSPSSLPKGVGTYHTLLHATWPSLYHPRECVTSLSPLLSGHSGRQEATP